MPAGSQEQGLAAAVIGDIVGSKRAGDRRELHRAVVAALHTANAELQLIQPFDVTIGDEFQGVLPTVEEAVRASLIIRLQLLPEVDARFGIGWGHFEVFEPNRQPPSQDGPAWWSAREAIEVVAMRESLRGHARHLRTWFVDGTEGSSSDRHGGSRTQYERAMNAFLLCRDELVADKSYRARDAVLGWVSGNSQAEIAAAAGVSQSAISQQLRRAGAFAVRDAHDLMDGKPAWKS